MANASFTRDEVILALDVLYYCGENAIRATHPAIQELSRILQKLPIHKPEPDNPSFRSCTGVTKQIRHFVKAKNGEPHDALGKLFFIVDSEFQGRHSELHTVASAIRRNIGEYQTFLFGSDLEELGFSEGILLGHLHRVIEKRDSAKLIPQTRCAICQIETSSIYRDIPNLMEMHLTVPVTELDVNKKYKETDFITVCPNCHAALHRYRPWLTKDNCGDVLR